MKRKVKSFLYDLWKDESGQGTAEYVLILVGVVALGFLFKDKIVSVVGNKMGDLGDRISSFNPDTN